MPEINFTLELINFVTFFLIVFFPSRIGTPFFSDSMSLTFASQKTRPWSTAWTSPSLQRAQWPAAKRDPAPSHHPCWRTRGRSTSLCPSHWPWIHWGHLGVTHAILPTSMPVCLGSKSALLVCLYSFFQPVCVCWKFTLDVYYLITYLHVVSDSVRCFLSCFSHRLFPNLHIY